MLSEPDTVLGPAFTKAGMKWILPPAPYGFAGTDAWLATIAGALGRRKITVGPSTAQKEAARELWRRARCYAAGFVLAAEEISLLSGSAALKMVPVLPVLEEAGFKVRLFIMRDRSSNPDCGASYGGKALPPGRRLPVRFFKTPEELRTLWRADRALRLVYSDIRADSRVVSAGKNPFSASLFEPGYAGALETWRRLLELCESDFNERYLAS